MWKWLDQNAQPIQALAAIFTVLAAVVAVVVIPIQLRTEDQVQREQSAREIYREFLSLTANKPEFAAAEYCSMTDKKDIVAYQTYVEYALYTAEQMITTSNEWRAPMSGYLADHLEYICSNDNWESQSEQVILLIEELQKKCNDVPVCPGK